MDYFPVAGIAAFLAVGTFVDIPPCVRAAVFDPHALPFHAVADHFFPVHADGAGIHGAEGDTLLLKGFHALEVQIDEWGDFFLLAVKVSSKVVMGRVQQEFADLIIRKESPHSHEGMYKADGVMHGCRIQEWENREVMLRVSGSVDTSRGLTPAIFDKLSIKFL